MERKGATSEPTESSPEKLPPLLGYDRPQWVTDTLILPLPRIPAPPSLSPTAPDGQALLSHPPAPTHSTPQPRPWLRPQPPGLDDCCSHRTKEPVALPLASLCSNPSSAPRRRDFLNGFLTCPGWVVFPHSLCALPTPEVRCWVERGCRSFAASCLASTSGQHSHQSLCLQIF